MPVANRCCSEFASLQKDHRVRGKESPIVLMVRWMRERCAGLVWRRSREAGSPIPRASKRESRARLRGTGLRRQAVMRVEYLYSGAHTLPFGEGLFQRSI